jgi:molybdopterin converting factor small subunit
MQLKVEFLGLARELAGTREGLVEIEPQATWRDVVRHLALQYPALVGVVIIPDHHDLAPSYMFNVSGRAMVRDLDMPAQAGERLLLMFAEAGG